MTDNRAKRDAGRDKTEQQKNSRNSSNVNQDARPIPKKKTYRDPFEEFIDECE